MQGQTIISWGFNRRILAWGPPFSARSVARFFFLFSFLRVLERHGPFFFMDEKNNYFELNPPSHQNSYIGRKVKPILISDGVQETKEKCGDGDRVFFIQFGITNSAG